MLLKYVYIKTNKFFASAASALRAHFSISYHPSQWSGEMEGHNHKERGR